MSTPSVDPTYKEWSTSKLFKTPFLSFGKIGTGPPPTDDLTVPTRDDVFIYQMSLETPLALTPTTLMVAKICETQHYADSVFSRSQKMGIITADGLPDTAKVDKSIVNKIEIISVPKIRELVNMLFFWEEECQRLRQLDLEISNLEGQDHEDGALKVLELKRKVVPSQRKPDGEIIGSGSETLPSYSA